MKDPHNVNWVLADIKYENVPLQDKYFKGAGFVTDSPREAVQKKLREMKRENSEEGIRERYAERLRGLLRGE